MSASKWFAYDISAWTDRRPLVRMAGIAGSSRRACLRGIDPYPAHDARSSAACLHLARRHGRRAFRFTAVIRFTIDASPCAAAHIVAANAASAGLEPGAGHQKPYDRLIGGLDHERRGA